jgi:hypothetical protein
MKTPEEMLELAKRDTPEKIIAFTTASRQFVPYAAKRLIEAENLIKRLEFCIYDDFSNECPICGATDVSEHSNNCSIKQFLEGK